MLYRRITEVIIDGKKFKDLTINFNIPFDDDHELNICEVEIYNLSDDSISNIKDGSKVILNAGYESDSGSILLGVVKKPSTEWEGVDKITTLTCLDGVEDWLKMNIQKTYKEGMTGEQILNDLITLTGYDIGDFNLPNIKTYELGKVINMSLADAIKSISNDCGAKVHINRGKIFIRPKSEGDNIGFILDKDKGLISSPTPIEKEEEINGETVKRQGFNVVTLLNHRITTDAKIKISSKTANGVFRVESGRHYKNNSGSFYTSMEVFND